jgi:hypothetical protein
MGGEDPERDQTDLPGIPVFFAAEDLPSWLREEGEASTPLPERETRARAAWAVTAAPSPPERETPFRVAAHATWNLLTAPPRHTKRGWRGGTR